MRQELAHAVGRTIARWRTARGMTQEELAVALDVDPMTVSRFERGVTLPSLLTVQQLAGVFDVSMAQMLEDAPAPEAGDAKVIAALMKNFSHGEREFVIETLKRYRATRRSIREDSGNAQVTSRPKPRAR